MTAKEKRKSHRAALGIAADEIIREIEAKKWDHIPAIYSTPLAECSAIITELKSRAPGFTELQYQDAISRSAFYNR